MNREIEEAVVRGLFSPDRADRVLFELASVKKRRTCIWRFSEKIFDGQDHLRVYRDLSDQEDVIRRLIALGASERCYVMSIDSSVDGAELRLEDAVRQLWGFGPALISCVHGRLAYLECEREGSLTDRLIVVRR